MNIHERHVTAEALISDKTQTYTYLTFKFYLSLNLRVRPLPAEHRSLFSGSLLDRSRPTLSPLLAV